MPVRTYFGRLRKRYIATNVIVVDRRMARRKGDPLAPGPADLIAPPARRPNLGALLQM